MNLKHTKREYTKRNNSKDYGDWIGKMNWKYMVTIRKNYKTTNNVIRKTAKGLLSNILSKSDFFKKLGYEFYVRWTCCTVINNFLFSIYKYVSRYSINSKFFNEGVIFSIK
jgi:hypothetical protein